jgi:hypothetical protein
MEEVIDSLTKELNKDLDVKENLEHDYLLTLSSKIQKWQTLFSKKTSKYKSLMIEKDIKFVELYKYYKFEFNIKLDKAEISSFVSADAEYREILKELNYNEVIISFCERAMKTLENQHWNLKTRLEYMKVLGYAD